MMKNGYSDFLYPKIMKQINLPFEIGQDYEVWEFDLEVMDVERMPNYDSVGKVKIFYR